MLAFGVVFRVSDIKLRVHGIGVAIVALFNDFGGRACDDGIIWELATFGDNAMARDDAIIADFRAIHNRRINADQAFVANRAAVQSCFMPDGAIAAYAQRIANIRM